MYRTLAPRVRSRCPYPRFVGEMKVMQALTGGRVVIRNIVVRVSGRRASAAYKMVAGGEVVGAPTVKNPDKFVRIGDRWFDDLDSGTPCSNA